jgi:hypothetical protein
VLISPAYAQAAGSGTGSDWMAFLPMFVISLLFSPICYLIALQKGRNDKILSILEKNKPLP